MNRSRPIAAGLLACAALLASCGSSGSNAGGTTLPPEPITVVVTNDDGISAPGIDALATALDALDGVTVAVVAPAENQSARGGLLTEGEVTHASGTTASGREGTAVNGTPADSVRVALDVLGLEPDLVASGVNWGQNVGPTIEVSGTVGAALYAADHGVPAIAVGAGATDKADFAGAAQAVIDWVVEHRAAIAAGTMPLDSVPNINFPECTSGAPRALVEVPIAKSVPEDTNPFFADCETASDDPPFDDVDATSRGFASYVLVPVE